MSGSTVSGLLGRRQAGDGGRVLRSSIAGDRGATRGHEVAVVQGRGWSGGLSERLLLR
jgi:hypothetical protein